MLTDAREQNKTGNQRPNDASHHIHRIGSAGAARISAGPTVNEHGREKSDDGREWPDAQDDPQKSLHRDAHAGRD